MKRLSLLVLSLLLSMAARSQTEQKPLRLGIGLFGTAYSGDLTTDGDALHRFYPGANISLQFATPKLISPQLNVGFGRFVSQDRDIAAVEGVQPNTFVDTRFFYVDFRLKARFLRESWFHPYGSLGIGLLGYTPRDQDGNNLLDNVSTRQDGETYGTITASFPLSLGMEFEMSHLVMLGLEYTLRPTGTDFLDNISALGPDSGNDRLQALLLSVTFTFDPDRPINQKDLRGKDR